jgi:putative endonuclease
MSKTYYVYILRCRDGSYYTGITNDFERRLEEHAAGTDGKCYTVKRRPVKLIYRSEFQDVNEAIHWEKIVKRWSRAKKEALIRGQYEDLPSLSVCANGTHYRAYKNIKCHAERSRSVISLILLNCFHPSTTLGMTQLHGFPN